MARPGGIIQAFCEPVTTTSRSQASISKGMAPTALMPSTRMSVSGASSRMAAASSAQRVGDAGGGLVEGHQHGPGRSSLGGHGPDRLADLVRVGRLAPLDLQAGHVCAVGGGDLREAVAEVADADAEDGVARREEADDRRLEPARARRGEDEDVLRGAESRAHARRSRA